MAESIVVNTFDTTVQSDGNGEDLSAADDTLLVTSAGSIVDTDGDTAVNSTANNAIMTVDGLVYNAGSGTSGNGVVMSGSDSTLSVNGTVQGGYHGIFVGGGSGTIGVYVYDGSSDSIVNTGNISGYTGIYLDANVGEESIENSGTIAGVGASNSSGIASGGSNSGVEIVNSGLITNSAANPPENMAAVLFFDDDAGTVSTIDNKGTISGAGAVIQTLSDILNITNSGTIDGALYAAAGASVSVSNSGLWQGSGEPGGNEWSLNNYTNILTNTGTIQSYIIFDSGGDTIDKAGTNDGVDSIESGGDTFTNSASGRIDGAVAFTGTAATNSLTNAGVITGAVTMAGGSTTLTNHGHIYGDVSLAANETLTNTGVIHGDLTLAGTDTVNTSRGEITGVINAGKTDTFEFSGNFGDETIDKFIAGSGSTHDTIQFAANDFGSFSAVKSAMSQVGSDVLIRLDATDSVVLNGVTLSNLVAADFKFV